MGVNQNELKQVLAIIKLTKQEQENNQIRAQEGGKHRTWEHWSDSYSPLPNGNGEGGGCSGGLKGHETGQDRRPPGCPFRDPRWSGELGRPWQVSELGRPWRVRELGRPWRVRELGRPWQNRSLWRPWRVRGLRRPWRSRGFRAPWRDRRRSPSPHQWISVFLVKWYVKEGYKY